MPTPQFQKFWQAIASREAELGTPFRIKARFSGDPGALTPVEIVLEDGQPVIDVNEGLASLIGTIDPQRATQNLKESEATLWRQALAEIRGKSRLTLNQVCRLVLGPRYRTERTGHTYNANVELLVSSRDVAAWVPGWTSTKKEVPLGDLYEGDDASDGERSDANQIAFRAIKSVLRGAAPFEFRIAGTNVAVDVETMPGPSWPREITGLDEDRDGPFPAPVEVHCSWPGGGAKLIVKASAWNGHDSHGDSCGIAIQEGSQELLWITVPIAVGNLTDGEIGKAVANVGIFKKREPLGKDSDAGTRALVRMLKELGIPFPTPKRAEAFKVRVPTGEVEPSPSEAFATLVQIALAKLPFMTRIDHLVPLFNPREAALGARDQLSVVQGEKHAGLYPLPGGVRAYQETLNKILEWVAAEPRDIKAFDAFMLDEFEVTGAVALDSYRNLLKAIGLIANEDGKLALTRPGKNYLANRSPEHLFELLHARYVGILETLVVIDEGTNGGTEISEALQKLLGTKWRTANQVGFRRNWLLSLGMTERGDEGDTVSPRGKALLAKYENEATPIRERLDERAVREGVESDDDDDDEEVSGDIAKPLGAPPGWNDDRVDLRAEKVREHLASLSLSESVLQQAAAALSSGKHLLLVGPPGTGKTEFAHCLASAAQAEGYCAGIFASTASADWTTYETVGGYALQRDNSLSFRPGVFLRALEKLQWLLIDELNRADIDKAFGELMTVLSGKRADTPFVDDAGRAVCIGPQQANMTHVLPKTFRVIATMNIWDKTSLFRLSYAVQRRFAFIHVGVPAPEIYASLLRREATKDWMEPPLAESVVARLVELFRPDALLAIRDVGPAIPLDMIRYMRRRGAEYFGVAEAIAMFLLPQLEGIDPMLAERLWDLLVASLAGDVEARSYLRARFLELFPLAELPKE